MGVETLERMPLTLNAKTVSANDRQIAMTMPDTTLAVHDASDLAARPAMPLRASPEMPIGYLAAVTPALESALAHAHEAGHERAVRILHAVLALLDDPARR